MAGRHDTRLRSACHNPVGRRTRRGFVAPAALVNGAAHQDPAPRRCWAEHILVEYHPDARDTGHLTGARCRPAAVGSVHLYAKSDKGLTYQYDLKSTKFPRGIFTLTYTVADDPVVQTVRSVIK